jgi:hypothetical protein
MNAKDPPTTAAASPSPDSLRLTFAYRGRDVRLVASRRVAMIAPPPVSPAPASGQSGHWCELRGASGDLLYHRALGSPMPDAVEVFADEASEALRRVPVPTPEGQFDVLVPDLPAARTFLFFGTPPGAASEAAPSRELFRADVDELRKARGNVPAPDAGGAQSGSEPK